MAISQTYEIAPAPFNSDEADFGGTFRDDQFIFGSSRQKTSITYNEDSVNTFFTDLYQTHLNSQGQWVTPTPINGRVNSIMNEAQCTFSSNGKSMYFTGNLKNALSKKKEKSEKYELGIFHATLYNKEWIEDGSFHYNSQQSEYSCGHPCLGHGDSLLYFSSNQPGGMGGSDLYYCTWQEQRWSPPVNMGPIINTSGNEFFPFINEYGVFFFSSDSREDSEGLDIYSTEMLDGQFIEPLRLSEPINSSADDFAYSEKKGSNKGCISSNRESANDDLYLFVRYEDDYRHCVTNDQPIFCYSITDENYPRLDTLPYVYEWQFSDGTIQRGSKVQHCFSDFGLHHIALNIRDTLTKNLITIANKHDITIGKPNEAFIKVPLIWSVLAPSRASIVWPEYHDIDTTKVVWLLNEEEIGRGHEVQHLVTTPGTYTLTCRLQTNTQKKKSSKKICIEQQITVQPDSLEIRDQNYQEIWLSSPDQMTSADGTHILPKYHISVMRSNQSENLTDELLEKIGRPVLEMKNDTEYIYVLEDLSELSAAIGSLEKAKKRGLTAELITCLNMESLYQPIREIRWNPGNSSLTTSTAHVASAEQTTYIAPHSDYDRQVRYTAAVMNLEPTLSLKIVSYYNSEETVDHAQSIALKIREHLIALHVNPALIIIATEMQSNIASSKWLKLILEYPHQATSNE
jgi:hypothetical protein